MKNFKINPEVTKVEFRTSIPAVELTRLGWEFNAPEYEGDINLLFTNYGTDNGVVCLWSFDIDGADCEDSGDTEKSIEDLLHLLNSGVIKYNEDLDYSENEEEGYCPWVTRILETRKSNCFQPSYRRKSNRKLPTSIRKAKKQYKKTYCRTLYPEKKVKTLFGVSAKHGRCKPAVVFKVYFCMQGD
jgi:hypothetical protein